MAPPKRKTGGRVTAAGTKPGDRTAATPAKAARNAAAGAVGPSSRYTPPVPQRLKESPPWVPVLMLSFFVLGGVSIMLRYLVFDSGWPLFVGLACLLAGLYTATKWR